jgi:hypothetical protein
MKDNKPIYHVFTSEEIDKVVKESDIKPAEEEA